MRKYILILSTLMITLGASSQTFVKWPFGAADYQTIDIDNDTITLTIKNSLTYVTSADTMLGTSVLLATTSSEVKAGSFLFIELKSTAAVGRTVTPSSAYFKGVAVSGVANKTKLIQFIYNGTLWVYVSSFQID